MPDNISPKPGAAEPEARPLPQEPEGPPNIIVRRGMKMPPTRDMILNGQVKIRVR
jgi:hypothetical protein